MYEPYTRIGIQFNWIEGTAPEKIDLDDFLNPYKSLGIFSRKDHFDVKFTNKEIKRLGNNILNNRKLNIVRQAIAKYVEYSDYTNIYTFFNSEKVIPNLPDFIQNEMNGQDRVRAEVITDKKVFANNFEEIITAPKVFKIIRKNSIVVFYNELYKSVANRNFALNQEMTIEIALEDKREWYGDEDNLNLSTQLALPRST